MKTKKKHIIAYLFVCMFVCPGFASYTYEVYTYDLSLALDGEQTILVDLQGGMEYLRLSDDSFADIKGMKIRAPQIEGVVAGLQQLGAKPTVIPFNEVYSALQQGVVDGLATLGSLMISQKFYEVVKHVYRNDWGMGLDKMLINSNTWNALSPTNQEILKSSFLEMEPSLYFKKTMDDGFCLFPTLTCPKNIDHGDTA